MNIKLGFWSTGFYPGYYVTFLSGALFTEAARWVRNHDRKRLVFLRKISVIVCLIGSTSLSTIVPEMAFHSDMLRLYHLLRDQSGFGLLHIPFRSLGIALCLEHLQVSSPFMIIFIILL